VTTPEIDHLMGLARSAGSLASKVCGAGGGGCITFLVEPARKPSVSAALTAAGATVLPFSIEAEGLKIEKA
jgi:D-glycero-alpha-D-manno-heptose-7-phosphate kinase